MDDDTMDDDTKERLLGVLFGVIHLAVLPFAIMLRGWVLTRLWFWFLVTQFHLPPLGVAQAIGLALTLTMLISRAQTCQKDDRPLWERALEDTARCIVRPLLVLLFGFIVYSFVC